MIRSIRQFARPAAVLATLAALVAPSLFPSGTTAWEMNSYADFVGAASTASRSAAKAASRSRPKSRPSSRPTSP